MWLIMAAYKHIRILHETTAEAEKANTTQEITFYLPVLSYSRKYSAAEIASSEPR